MRLHNEELKDLATASAALVFIFSYPQFLSTPSILLVSAIAIVSGFAFHELAHRLVANSFGAAARFRMWKEGLIMALALAIATNGGFVFAAPGAVMVSGVKFTVRHGLVALGRREYGLISAAGPATNLIAASIFLLLHSLIQNNALLYAASINVTLALFNMLPIPPLDGSKVFAWNPAVWAAIIAAVIAFRIFLI
ncbi:MAG: site-2 protease family protein [Candidatus Aenigmarchaeota archaeon]|nr:site-2 protease family protein [Candidatus Aenigmarchaeota archaeon]